MSSLMTLDGLKQQAKSLRRSLDGSGQPISHSKSLEIVARQHGYRDWNTLHAAVGNRAPMSFQVGQRVSGRYLGQAFNGQVIAVSSFGDKRFRLTLRFDEAVDVITFEGWSAFRRQVNATVDRHGQTAEKTSDGQPHLVIDAA